MTIQALGLNGRTAIITGAARGIGLAAATRLTEEGVNIVAFDQPGADFSDVQAAGSKNGTRIINFEGDVSNASDWDRAVDVTVEAFGRVDILFNNAGISGPIRNVINYPEEDFNRVIAVNVQGVFLGLQRVGRQMQQQKSGVIVNTSSISGFGGGGNVFAYTTSKFAVNGMTKSAAITLAPDGVRVLAIAPCPTETEMMFQLERKISPDAPEDARPELAKGIPVGRYGKPDEIAAVFAFLVSDQASFMTGAIVPTDGGVLAK